ncbi:SRPBCC domain-containing protein [Spirochaetia bacterium 38H-sp]|uniref:SRPBCC domain-containing protein n=1 Tax=Rarispira pelagica TaxID=3141764 RepID=A0ABU9U9G9_9SPIR
MESFILEAIVPAPTHKVFKVLTTGTDYAEVTGCEAEIQPWTQGIIAVWNGYGQGIIIEIEEPSYIKHTWRTSDYQPQMRDSEIEILVNPWGKKTKLTIKAINIPDNLLQEEKTNWQRFLLEPLVQYFL